MSLGSPFQHLAILVLKNSFLISNWDFSCCNVGPMPLICLLCLSEKRLAPLSQEPSASGSLQLGPPLAPASPG